MKSDRGIEGVRVCAGKPNVQGVVVIDKGGSRVCVLWDDEDETWSRRDLLYLVGEWDTDED